LGDEEKYLVTLVYAAIPHAVPPIHVFNKFLYVSEEGGATLTATLSEKDYSGTSLAAEIESALNGMSGGTGTYTVTFDAETMFLTITSDVSFQFVIVETSGDTFDAYDEIGFNRYALPSGTVQTSVGPILVGGTTSIVIAANMTTNMYVPGVAILNGLAIVPMVGAFGSTVYHQPPLNPMLIPSRHMQQWSIQLRDQKGRIWPLPPNAHYELYFKLEAVPPKWNMGIPQNRREDYHHLSSLQQQLDFRNETPHDSHPLW
jgi:hypothetical protein